MHLETIKLKKGKSSYKVHVKHHGVYKTKTFKRKHNALAWGHEMEALLEGYGRVNITFRALAAEWIENHSKVKNAPKSYLDNESKLRFINPIIGDKVAAEITYGDIEILTARLLKTRPKKNVSINRYLTLVRTILNYAVRRGDLLGNPIRKEHFLPEHEVGFQYWQQEQAERFLAHAEEKYKNRQSYVLLLYKLALNTGMRWGELIALKWDSVFLGSHPSITVQRTYCSKSRQIRETTKGGRIRYIGINEVLLKALKAAHENLIADCDLVITSHLKQCLDHRSLAKRHFVKDIKEADVPKIRFHDMRHTFASLFMMNGGSIFDLQKILGHRDLQTTMRYAHLAKDYILDKSNVVVVGKRENVIAIDFRKKQVS